MIEGLHRHLLHELERAGRADTVFVVGGVCFNFLVLAINWVHAFHVAETFSGRYRDGIDLRSPILLLIFMGGAVLVTVACLSTLRNSQKTCETLHAALTEIYEDTDVAKYVPPLLHGLSRIRFRLSLIIVGATGVLSVMVPLIVLFFG